MTNHRLIKLAEVERLTGLAHAWIYELIRRGQFPSQIKVGARASRWVEADVQAWIEARIASSRSFLDL